MHKLPGRRDVGQSELAQLPGGWELGCTSGLELMLELSLLLCGDLGIAFAEDLLERLDVPLRSSCGYVYSGRLVSMYIRKLTARYRYGSQLTGVEAGDLPGDPTVVSVGPTTSLGIRTLRSNEHAGLGLRETELFSHCYDGGLAKVVVVVDSVVEAVRTLLASISLLLLLLLCERIFLLLGDGVWLRLIERGRREVVIAVGRSHFED